MRIAGIIITAVGALFLIVAVKLVLTELDLSKPYDQGRCFGSFAFAVIVIAAGVKLLNKGGKTESEQAFGASTDGDADRQIQMVIRILQYVGWPFSILCGLLAVATLGLALFVLTMGETESLWAVALGAILSTGAALFFAAFIWVAREMRARNPKAKNPAIALSALMLIGFPLFTIVGIVCLTVITSKYSAYCATEGIPPSTQA